MSSVGKQATPTVSGGSAPPEQWLVGSSSILIRPFGEELVATCTSAGLQCVELTLFGEGLDAMKASDVAELGRRAKVIQDHGLLLWSVHLPFGRLFDIATPDEATRDRTIRLHTELLARAGEWGATVAVIHASTEPIPDAERQEYLARSKEGLAGLAEVARANEVRLAVECLPRTCLANTSLELEWLLDGVEHAWVCYDANHLLQEIAEEFITRLGDRIITVHMSDYDGVDERHWLPGEGINHWPAIVAALARAGYGGPFLYEVGSHSDGSVTPAALVECWRGILREYQRR